MVNKEDEWNEDDEEENWGEDEEEPKPRPKKTLKDEAQDVPNIPPRKGKYDRYTPFQIPQQEGIFDTQENKPFATEIWTVLSEILNKLNKIEKSI